uniref:Uncharacterized protein n=1 Tax=Mycena chlorophos TaxID=658473 RepID=A0ABQ0LPE3_MYCCL|nr:predicted protein [Mycena chlorophos]
MDEALSEKMVPIMCQCGTLKQMQHPSSCFVVIACSEAPLEMLEFTSALRGARLHWHSETLSLARVDLPTSEPDLAKIASRLATKTTSSREVTLSFGFTTWVFLDRGPHQRAARFVLNRRPSPPTESQVLVAIEERRPAPCRRPLSSSLELAVIFKVIALVLLNELPPTINRF